MTLAIPCHAPSPKITVKQIENVNINRSVYNAILSEERG